MIVRVIYVFVKKDNVDAFAEATKLNREASIEEPGVLRFDVLQDAEDSAHFILYEVYRSEKSTQAHKETEHYASWKKTVEPMMARPRSSTACRVIAPDEESAW